MKKAIVITSREFKELDLATIHGITRSELLIKSILSDPNFGNFDEVVCLSNLSFDDLQSRLEEEVANLEPKSLLYLHIISHGIAAPDGKVVLALKDSHKSNDNELSIRNCISPNFLANLIFKQSARDIGITLDCCLSVEFQKQMITALDRYEQPKLVQHGRRKKLHFISQATDHSDFAYSDQNGSRLTNKICEWLITGETASTSPLIEYPSFEKFSRHPQIQPKINYQPHNAKYGFNIGLNPNRGLLIEPSELRKLLSEDNLILLEGLHFLKEQVGFATSTRLTVIKKYLPLFEKLLPTTTSSEVKQEFLELTRTINGQRHSKRHKKRSILIYFTRNWRSALLVDRKLSKQGNDTLLFDLNFASKYNYRGDNLFEQIEYAKDVYFLVDTEWAQQVSSEHYELAAFLVEGHHSGKMNVILDVTNGSISEIIRPLRDIRSFSVDQFCKGVTFTASDETIGRSIFLDCLLVNQRKLEAQGGDNTRASDSEIFLDDAIKVRSAPTRIPNFLVYSTHSQHERKHILAIVDHESKVNPTKLMPDHRSVIVPELTKVDELAKLGMEPGKIGPIFPTSHKKLSRIIVDGNIFFQFLLFPFTPVRVPNVHAGVDHPIELPISSFIRAIQQFYGEKCILYSNIVRHKKFRDPILLELLAGHPIFTRFAPTPSSSLHLGNIRTALVSYLFVLSTKDRSRFHIRFDDTNPKHKKNEVERGDIIDDLNWVGIPTQAAYRQTSRNAHRVYDLAANILCSAGLLRNNEDNPDGRELNVEAIDQGFAYWLDLKKGPQFLHRAPTVFEHRSPEKVKYSDRVDYTIDWPDRSYKYKFAGVLDDLCLNTLVIRDGRQENSLFTARQSIILGALRRLIAKPMNDQIRSMAEAMKELAKDRVQLADMPNSEKSIRPFPFGAPPIYLHVPRVCDEDGKVLSKRLNEAQHSIKDIRTNGRLLPETVLCWAISTMGTRVLHAMGATGIRHLESIVATFGIKGTYELLSDRVRFVDLLLSQSTGDIRISKLNKSDARIFGKLGPIRFKELCHSLWETAGGRPGLYLDDLSVEELYLARNYFCGSDELFRFLRKLRLNCSSTKLDKLRSDIEVYLGTGSHPASIHESMRIRLIGERSGPPARVLALAALPSMLANQKISI
ncbi:MAG: glutamate--tRNA ligase family protein [Pseudomonadota bacterium]